jgi:hypothetical protein
MYLLGSRRCGVTLTIGLLLTLLHLTSCVEYSIDRQGNLQSIGVPGLPVWQTQTLAEQKRMAAEGNLSASPGAMVDPTATRFRAIASDATWLVHVNRWRTAARVDPIGENSWLSLGSTQHAQYLVKNGPSDAAAFHRYMQALDAAAHTEEFGNPYWTGEGNEAGQYGGIAWGKDSITDIDGLLIAPFHRLLILAPWAKVGGYGDYGSYPKRAEVLALRGATPVGIVQPVFFPPDGATMPTGAMVNAEFPNPLEACPGYTLPIGLPITVQVGASVRTQLKSYSLEDATTHSKVETCGIDAETYPDPYGQRVLSSYGAIVLIPRKPLASAHEYRVSINSHRSTYNWTFRIAETTPALSQVPQESIRRTRTSH